MPDAGTDMGTDSGRVFGMKAKAPVATENIHPSSLSNGPPADILRNLPHEKSWELSDREEAGRGLVRQSARGASCDHRREGEKLCRIVKRIIVKKNLHLNDTEKKMP